MEMASRGFTSPGASDPFTPSLRRVKLAGRVPAVIRQIRPDDDTRLSDSMHALSPETRRRRFLFSKGDFSAAELNDFTHRDGVHHLALVLIEIGPDGRERQIIAVARSIRDPVDLALAEVAITVADVWQHHGVGDLLLPELARQAWASGIRRWNALLFSNNIAMKKLLTLVGKKLSEHPEDSGVISLIYRLFPPPGLPRHPTKKAKATSAPR